jgi:hypothetical protein
MLLATFLVLAGALPLLQDTGTPAPDSQSSDPVSEFLEAVRGQLYDIQGAGLESLLFALPVTTPHPSTGESMSLGSVSVEWTVGAEPQFSVSVADDLPESMSSMTEMLESQLEGQGQQVLGYIRNDLFVILLEAYDASLEGTEDGLERVHFEPKQPEVPGQPPIDWYFRDQIPVLFKLSIEQVNVEMSFEHVWRPVSETDDSLVLQALKVTQDTGYAKVEATTTFDYVWSDGLLVLSGYLEEVSQPDAAPFLNELRLEGVQVNGASPGSAKGTAEGEPDDSGG